ncbi:MAG: protein kinase [Pirellulaceae bacterium]
MERCAKSKKLGLLLAGDLSPAEQQQMEQHVESCEDCQRELDERSGVDSQDFIVAANIGSSSNQNIPREVADRLAKHLHEQMAVETVAPQPTTHHLALPNDFTIGDYQIINEVGRGGMGTVFRARHSKLDRIVAIKILEADLYNLTLGDASRVSRFKRELRAIGRLRHPNIVAAYDAGEVGKYHYLAMEFIDGANLHQVVQARGPLTVSDACEITRQVALGLAHSHEMGLVHRDIKPSNIMLATNDDSALPKILDLGLSRFHERADSPNDPLTQAGQVMGTVDYMAPEQFGTSNVDFHADIYSLGATLYYLLTGRTQFTHLGDNLLERIRHRATQESVPISEMRTDLPEPLCNLIDSMLAENPQDRPSSCLDIANRLAPFCDGHQLTLLLPTEPIEHDAETRNVAAVQTRIDPAELNLAVTDKPITQRAQARPQTESHRDPWKRFRVWLFVGLAMIFMAIAGIVIRLKTDGGEIVIECNDPDLKLEIVRNESNVQSFAVGQLANHTWFRSGDYEIRIPSSPNTSVTIQNERFALLRGEKKLVTIHVERSEMLSDAEKADQARRNQPAKEIIEVFGSIEAVEPSEWIPNEDQALFLQSMESLPEAERVQATILKVLELNPKAKAPTTSFRNSELVGLEWNGGGVGLIWPLAALKHLESLTFEQDCITDYRPLQPLPLHNLQTHLVVANTEAIATIEQFTKLKTISDLPKQEFLDSIRALRTEINEFQSTMHRLTLREQAAWAADMIMRLNPQIPSEMYEHIKSAFRLVYMDEQHWEEFYFDGIAEMRDMSPLAVFNPPKIRIENCKTLYDVTPFRSMSNLRRLWLDGCYVFDVSPITALRLDSLGLSDCQIDSLEFARDMPLRETLKISHTGITSLEPIRGKYLKQVQLDHTDITDLEPLRGMPIVDFNAREILCHDFSPLAGMQLTEPLWIDRRWQSRLIDDYSWLKGMPASSIIVDPPRRFYQPDLDILRNLKCIDFNWKPKGLFWEEFESELAKIQSFVDEIKSLPASEQRTQVFDQLMNSGYSEGTRLDIVDDQIVSIRLALKESNDGLWPLRALQQLRSVQITGDYPQKLDLSALIDMQIEELVAPEAVLVQNDCVLRVMQSLRTINGSPVSEYWNR